MEIEDELTLDGCEKLLEKLEEKPSRQSRENKRLLPSERITRSHSLTSARSIPRSDSRDRGNQNELGRGLKRDLSLDSYQDGANLSQKPRSGVEKEKSKTTVSVKQSNVARDRSPHKLPGLDGALSGLRALTIRSKDGNDDQADRQDKAETAINALKTKVRTQLGVMPRQKTIYPDLSKVDADMALKPDKIADNQLEQVSKPILSPSLILSPSGGRTPRMMSPTQPLLNIATTAKLKTDGLAEKILASPSLHLSMLDHLPSGLNDSSPAEAVLVKSGPMDNVEKAIDNFCDDGGAMERQPTADEEDVMPRIMEEAENYFEYGDFENDSTHLDILAFHDGVGNTLDQYEKDKIEMEEKIIEMQEAHKKEIEALLATLKMDQAKMEYEMDIRDKELLIMKKECREKERLAEDLGSFQNALHDSAIKGSEQSKELHRLSNENSNKDAQIKELTLLLNSMSAENASLKHTLVKYSEADMERAKREDLLKKSAARLHLRHERVKRTTSVASLTNGGKSILMMADDGEFEQAALNDELGRKALKDYSWPSIGKVGNGEQYRRMIYKIVDEMCQEGISDKLITKSLKATLIENDPALFGRLEGKHNPRNLEDMLKMLQFMDSRETTLTMEERFTQTKQKDSESALDYMDRLESLFDDLFGKDATGKLRRIKKHFLDSFNERGVYLSESEKDAAEAHSTLIDVAMKAEQKMKRRSEAAKQSRANQRFSQQPQRSLLRQASPQPSINYVNTQQGARNGNSGNFQHAGNNFRNQPGNQRQNNAYPQATLRSAGPDAVRVSLREFNADKADDGSMFCYKCLQKNHIFKDCQFFPACAWCNGEELYHWTKHHDTWLTKQNQPTIERQTMQNAS